jgi:4-aminobutyrate aminotransferase-like enzyme
MNRDEVLEQLRRFESRNITQISEAAGWPMVWKRARGTAVWDCSDRKYLDLTAAFGVAAAGHGNPRVVAAGRRQMGTLLHAMGDVHPHPGKAKLLAELSRRTYERWAGRGDAKTILTGSGSEAVEAAMKTARLATGRPGVIAFEGAYHGLGYGALNATHREHFRARFADQLGGFCCFLPFPACETCDCAASGVGCAGVGNLQAALEALPRRGEIGAVLVEPIQARGGIRVPPAGFLRLLRDWCDRHGALLVLDEIYTGFGRTGDWFACEQAAVVPDLVCLGKAMTGGFPMGACVGRAELMDEAWPASDGEAIHTSTFLGHPVGCAMAVAQLSELDEQGLVQRAATEGHWLRAALTQVCTSIRHLRMRPVGRGLMAGIEVRRLDGSPAGDLVIRAMHRLLSEGFIVLPEGAEAEVLSLTPPLTIRRRDLARAIEAMHGCFEDFAE